jgi:hypothetical protein
MPVSAMLVASYLRTQKDQDPPPDGGRANDNVALDQFSLFIAGGLGEHLGGFVQTTYDGVAKTWHWDNLDLRAVTDVKLGKTDVTLGASLNNAPTVQDAWNTLPAWGYPYTGSALAPSPSTSPLLNGALAQTSLGATAYAWIDGTYYVEGGAYWSPGARQLSDLGADPTSPGSIDGAAPYGRIAFQHDVGPGTLELGAFGMRADIHPGLDVSTGLTDRYTDVGVDGSYYAALADADVITINTRYLHEAQSLRATCALAGAGGGCASNTLNDVRFTGSYYWRNRIGLTVGVFDLTGSSNPTLYAGNRTFRPDSAGVTFQVDGTLFPASDSPLGRRFNARAGLQYTHYTRFDGARRDFDGLGANAADNDALRLFLWAAY